MKKILLTTFLLMTTILIGCGSEQDSANTTNIKFKRILVIGMDAEYAPMGFRNEKNQIVGFDVDLAKETGKRMGVTFEFKPIEWNNKRHELESGEIDLLWNGLDISPERKEYMIFSKPYMDNRQILLVRKSDNLIIRSEGDLAGKVVGTQDGSTSEAYINKNESLKKTFVEFKTYVNYKDALQALTDGEIDVVVADELLSRYTAGNHPDKFEVIDVTIGPVTEIGIGFRKNDVELHDRLQKAFDEVIKDGTAKQISEKWFDADLLKLKR